jgi:hypothetical protein
MQKYEELQTYQESFCELWSYRASVLMIEEDTKGM